jgi:hypothetical protein
MMPAAKSADAADQNPELALAESLWKRIKNDFEQQRHQIYEEMKNYPRPIPACDLQFNHLLEKRAGILREMDRLHEARTQGLERGGALNLLEEFVRASSYLDAEIRETIRAFVEESRRYYEQADKLPMDSPVL